MEPSSRKPVPRYWAVVLPLLLAEMVFVLLRQPPDPELTTVLHLAQAASVAAFVLAIAGFAKAWRERG